MKQITRVTLMSFLLLFAARSFADLRVRKSDNVDYSWVESTFFSDDETRLDTVIRAEVNGASKYVDQAVLHGYLNGINDPANQRILRQTYRLNNKAYLTLVRLAIGIMYAESKLGTHPRYLFKERFPWTVVLAKEFLDSSKFDFATYQKTIDDGTNGLVLEYLALNDESFDAPTMAAYMFDLSENSRGPTQIKYLPESFHKIFPHINKNNLRVPEFAAVATIAYLADAIHTLKRLSEKFYCEIPREYFLQHLLYIYVGRSSEIVNCEATLDRNLYWRRAVDVQNVITVSVVDSDPVYLLPHVRARIEAIQAEIRARHARQQTLNELITLIEAIRSQKLMIKPEDANLFLEYLLLIGVTTGSHVGLKKLSRYLPTFRKWSQQSKCARLLLGRKRYFAAMHIANGTLAYLLLRDPQLGFDAFMKADDDKLRLDKLRAALSKEALIVKRLQFDILLMETGL